MAIDYDGITTALAAKYVALTPPTGYGAIRVATGDLPGQMVPLPAVLLEWQAGELDSANGTRLGAHEVTARFYYNQNGDVARDIASLRKWLPVLTDTFATGASLSAKVVFVRTNGYQIGVFTYADQEYTGIELALEISTSEGWNVSA